MSTGTTLSIAPPVQISSGSKQERHKLAGELVDEMRVGFVTHGLIL